MFDEKKFQNDYKNAYDKLTLDGGKVEFVKNVCSKKNVKGKRNYMKMGVALGGVACMLLFLSNPVLAGMGNFAYEKIAELSPGLAEYILPVKLADTRMGITMQVEAMQVEGNTGELVVSFADEEGSSEDLISGKVDMYDSYGLKSYGSDSNVGGCSFLEYDEETGKAYFKIGVSSEDEFDKSKLKFTVRQLLVENTEYEMWLDKDTLVMNPVLKEVPIDGKGGTELVFETLADHFYKTEESFPLFSSKVMDMGELDESMKDTIQVTGIGYGDGILRVQICRGTFAHADRHAEIYVVDGEGNYRNHDASVGWQEELDGENLSFDEQWFLVSEEELEELQLYARLYETDGSIEGNWHVTVNLENGMNLMMVPTE